MRLAVYTDYVYWRDGDAVFAERAFALFLARLDELFDDLVLVGRVSARPSGGYYRLRPGIELVALPNHPGLLASPRSTARALIGSIKPVWDLLPRVDAIWLLGPHPLVPVMAALATVRRRPFAVGVRQDTPRYVRRRYPRSRVAWLAADLLEGLNLAMARRAPTVVVGPELAHRYRRAPRLLPIVVSLVREKDIVTLEQALSRPYAGQLCALSVGRLEREKNPLLLADIADRLQRAGGRWRIEVCGDGPLRGALAERLRHAWRERMRGARLRSHGPRAVRAPSGRGRAHAPSCSATVSSPTACLGPAGGSCSGIVDSSSTRSGSVRSTMTAGACVRGRPRPLSATGSWRSRARPDVQGVALTLWLLPKLRQHLAQMGIVLNEEALRQTLIAAGLSHQRTRSWKWSPDPGYQAKAERVLGLYRECPPRGGGLL